MSQILAIDPGTTESGWCIWDGKRVISSGIDANQHVRNAILQWDKDLAIEMIASYGMAVGKEVFETVLWIGRFTECHWKGAEAVRLVYRKEVKLHLCGSPRAKDANIRQALIDLIGPQGTKKSPGPTHGVKSHAWAALAVAVTAGAQL